MSGDQFLNHVTATLEKQQLKSHCSSFEDGTVLQQFFLSLDDDTPLPDNRFDGALCFAAENSVKDLHLVGQDCRPPLPTIAFAKSITKLTLTAFNLDNFNELIQRCPLLRKLRLYNCRGLKNFKFSSSEIRTIKLKSYKHTESVEINSPSLQSFSFSCYRTDKLCESFSLTNCKSLKFLKVGGARLTDDWVSRIVTQLETIKLSHCNELNTFKVSNLSSLKRIDLSFCKRLESIEIGAINLEYFRYRGIHERVGSVPIDIGACKHLKEIVLAGAGIPKELLQGHVLSELLELEKLVLFLTWFHHKVEINHQHLKSLSIYNPSSANIRINTPRLVSFEYNGKFSPLYPLRHETLLNECDIGFYSVDVVPDTSYLINWSEFLLHLGPCKLLKLKCAFIELLVFPEDLRKTLIAPLLGLKNLVIEVRDSPRLSTELVDSLLWMSPYLDTLVFNWVALDVALSINFNYETIMSEEDICSLATPTEFLSLKHVEMESSGSVEEKENLLTYFKGKSKSVNWKSDY